MATERLYYDEPALLEFTARVADVKEFARQGTAATWAIRLDRTAFYPTSGGQPFDTGVLEASAKSGAKLELPVIDVIDDEHDEIWHLSQKVIEPGAEVTGRIAKSRRIDHMQQHTGQHLLSAAFVRLCNAPTVSFHLGDTTSTIDLQTAPISVERLREVERLCNEVIAEDRAVSITYASREEASAQGVRKLPEREGTIRLIEIYDFDLNACGGTHVNSTGQIGSLLLRKIENVKQGVRVEFVCGLRALDAARRDFETLTEAAGLFSAAPFEVPAQIRRAQQETKGAQKQQLKVAEELADYMARDLLANAPQHAGCRIVRRLFADRDLPFAKLIAQKVARAAGKSVALIAVSDASPTLIFSRSAEVSVDVGALLKELVTAAGGRGGGGKDLAQGGVPEASKLEGLLAQAEQKVRALLSD